MNIQNILKEHNKSLTKERKDIFEYATEKHIFSYSDMLSHFDTIGRASIFRTLNLFLEIGVIRRVHLSGRAEYYELNSECHHHEHMECSDCGDVISFESKNICKKILEEAKKIGFEIKEHSISVIGKCKKCQCT